MLRISRLYASAFSGFELVACQAGNRSQGVRNLVIDIVDLHEISCLLPEFRVGAQFGLVIAACKHLKINIGLTPQ